MPSIWGYDALDLGDPWGIDTVDRRRGGARREGPVDHRLGRCRAARLLRCSSGSPAWGSPCGPRRFDQEAALARGISVRRVFAWSWGIAGAVAALAGVTLGSGPAAVTPSLGLIALAAFPAMILGGLDSPNGAVIGGLVIGVTQTLTAGYQPEYAAFLGNNFYVGHALRGDDRHPADPAVRPVRDQGGAAAMSPRLRLRTARPTPPWCASTATTCTSSRPARPASRWPCSIVLAALAPLELSDVPVLGARLRRHRRDRRHRSQPAHRVHRPGLARPRVLHRRRAPTSPATSAASRTGRSSCASCVAAAVGGLIGARHRTVRAASAWQLPRHHHARPGVPRSARVRELDVGHRRPERHTGGRRRRSSAR